MSAAESDDPASQHLAYHAFIDCDLHPPAHFHHYGRHIGRHGDDVQHVHHHQQLMHETPYRDSGKCDVKLQQHQYESVPHNVQLVYWQQPAAAAAASAACTLSGQQQQRASLAQCTQLTDTGAADPHC